MSMEPNGECLSCRRPVVWAVTEHGAAIAVEPRPVDGGNIVFTGDLARTERGARPRVRVLPAGRLVDVEDCYVAHSSACPDVARYRGRHRR